MGTFEKVFKYLKLSLLPSPELGTPLSSSMLKFVIDQYALTNLQYSFNELMIF